VTLSRRKFLALAGATTASTFMVSPLEAFYARAARGQSTAGRGYGPLSPKLPKNTASLGRFSGAPLLELPAGFEYTAFSITGDLMSDGTRVPGAHDGMAAYPGPRGTTILVRNHELGGGSSTAVAASNDKKYDPLAKGGTTNLVVDRNGNLIRHFASLSGTARNCAGGPTPWGTWVTCEENISTPAGNTAGNANNVSRLHGYNFEVPANARGLVTPEPLIAMGRFNHEAIAVDPATGYVYETEDRGDSCFYRFRPTQPGNLRAGVLEAMVITGRPTFNTGERSLALKGVPLPVEWVKIDDVNPTGDTLRLEAQRKGAATFVRGEGAWYGNGLIYIVSTSGGEARLGQVFAYNPANETLTLVVESTVETELGAPDNITVAPNGELFLCEDGSGDEFIVGVTRQGELYKFMKNIVPNNTGSESAGVCFSPDGSKMFFNIQSPGITCCVWGPW
jgi:uncharacterized protein